LEPGAEYVHGRDQQHRNTEDDQEGKSPVEGELREEECCDSHQLDPVPPAEDCAAKSLGSA